MAIDGLTNVYQQQRQLPKLRLGLIDETPGKDGRARKFPKNPDHFCFDPDEVPEVVAVYGEQPKEIHAILVGNNVDEIMPANYQFYISSGQNWFMNCSGDGKTGAWYARHLKKTPGVELVEGYHDGKQKPGSFLRKGCGETCPDYMAKPQRCKMTARIRVMLPLVSTSTVYEIVTHSRNTIIDFSAAIQNAQRDLSFGHGMGVVFKLSKNEVKKQKVKEDESGTQVQHFAYLTCQKDDTFWDTYKEQFMDKIRKSAGLDVKNKLILEFGISPTGIQNELQAQIRAADQYALQAPPVEMVNESTGEIIEAEPIAPPLENDTEVIEAVRATLASVGMKLEKDSVKNAIKKWGNSKEKILTSANDFIVKQKKVREEKEAKAIAEQAPPMTEKRVEQTQTANESLL
jgi:hypothetical protein